MKIIVVPSKGAARISFSPAELRGAGGVETVIAHQLLEVATISATQNRIMIDFAVADSLEQNPSMPDAYVIVPLDGEGDPLEVDVRVRTRDFKRYRERVLGYAKVHTWANVISEREDAAQRFGAAVNWTEAQIRAFQDAMRELGKRAGAAVDSAIFDEFTSIRSWLQTYEYRSTSNSRGTREAPTPQARAKADKDALAAARIRAARSLDAASARLGVHNRAGASPPPHVNARNQLPRRN